MNKKRISISAICVIGMARFGFGQRELGGQ